MFLCCRLDEAAEWLEVIAVVRKEGWEEGDEARRGCWLGI